MHHPMTRKYAGRTSAEHIKQVPEADTDANLVAVRVRPVWIAGRLQLLAAASL